MKEKITDFVKLLSFIQASLNNFTNAFTRLVSNEVLYEFKVAESLKLLTRQYDENSTTFIEKERELLRKKVKKAIIFANAQMKMRYDLTRKSLNLKIDDVVYLKLHKEYNQSDLINRKFSKQRLKLVKILEKVEKLTYKLNILAI
jgi:hypothetical protein